MRVELLGSQHPASAVGDLGHQVANLGLHRAAQRRCWTMIEIDLRGAGVAGKLRGEPQLAGGVATVSDPAIGHSQWRILCVRARTER